MLASCGTPRRSGPKADRVLGGEAFEIHSRGVHTAEPHPASREESGDADGRSIHSVVPPTRVKKLFELRDRRASQTRRAEPTRARPKPPSREVRLASGAHVSRGRGASGNRSGKPARLACCVVLFSRVTHRTSGRDGSPGRGREARRDLHVRGSMADLRHGMECASPETPPRARRALTPNQHANADAHRAIGAISRAPPTWRQRHTRKPPSATDVSFVPPNSLDGGPTASRFTRR